MISKLDVVVMEGPNQIIIEKIQKKNISASLFIMGRERVSYLPTKTSDVIAIPPNFKQFYGESIKDARVRINQINGKSWNSCEKKKLHL
jgi:hypothetical protein